MGDWSGIALPLGGWLLTYAIHSTTILGTVWLLGRAGLPLSPTAASALWKAGMLAAVVTPTLQLTLGVGPRPLELRRGEVGAATVVIRTARSSPILGPGVRGQVVRMRRRVEARCSHAGQSTIGRLHVPPDWRALCDAQAAVPPWATALVWIWGLGALSALGRLEWRRRRAGALLEDRQQLSAGDGPELVARLSDRVDRSKPVRLTVSGSIASPAASRDEIMLPMRTLWGLEAAEKQTVLAHELAHIERHDLEWLAVLRRVAAVFFFQPLNHVALNRFQDAAEHACDDRAVELTGDRLSLARSLERVGRWVDANRNAVPDTAIVRRCEPALVRRVERVLLAEHRRPPRLWRTASAAALLILPVMLLPRVSGGQDAPDVVHIVEEAVFIPGGTQRDSGAVATAPPSGPQTTSRTGVASP